MFRRCLGLTFAMLALAISPGTGGTSTAPVPRGTPTPRWEPLLAWLPEDTETLIVAPLGFEIPKPETEAKETDAKFDFSTAMQYLPTGPLLLVKDELLGKELAGQKVLCVVEGSRRFTRPGEFGLLPYEGCHILQFDAAADDTLKKVTRACLEKADKKIELAGVKVAMFSEKLNCDTWSYFVCRPRPNILICATNQDYLEETLKRIDQKPAARALPADLPEWKHVDTKARVWAIRHYRKETAKNDPSSPLNPVGRDADAVGFVFWMSANPESVVQIRYLSDAKDSLTIAKKTWEVAPEGKTPKIKPGEKGVIEIVASIPKKKDGEAVYFLLVLMGQLGHVVVC